MFDFERKKNKYSLSMCCFNKSAIIFNTELFPTVSLYGILKDKMANSRRQKKQLNSVD